MSSKLFARQSVFPAKFLLRRTFAARRGGVQRRGGGAVARGGAGREVDAAARAAVTWIDCVARRCIALARPSRVPLCLVLRVRCPSVPYWALTA